ncbi:DUF397 domain-containing protein [Nocardiopsis algeriensis]|uniref:DUF397 domain-containing protein n=1 Tax=Nocardiopsis algeriensis TaxID=1478215 RepID=A0A841IK11_9ACTN|nr:DUF397 domain-containing protein [Nocardiopsis algeriensis]MBB6119003.1 hypothetical protein [Nocardiopsis algeriensis]
MNSTLRSSWYKSSYSTAQSNCVEVAESVAGNAVRDSRHPEFGHLDFPVGEWFGLLVPLKQQVEP